MSERIRHKVSGQTGTVVIATKIGYWAVRFDGEQHASMVHSSSLELEVSDA